MATHVRVDLDGEPTGGEALVLKIENGSGKGPGIHEIVVKKRESIPAFAQRVAEVVNASQSSSLRGYRADVVDGGVRFHSDPHTQWPIAVLAESDDEAALRVACVAVN